MVLSSAFLSAGHRPACRPSSAGPDRARRRRRSRGPPTGPSPRQSSGSRPAGARNRRSRPPASRGRLVELGRLAAAGLRRDDPGQLVDLELGLERARPGLRRPLDPDDLVEPAQQRAQATGDALVLLHRLDRLTCARSRPRRRITDAHVDAGDEAVGVDLVVDPPALGRQMPDRRRSARGPGDGSGARRRARATPRRARRASLLAPRRSSRRGRRSTHRRVEVRLPSALRPVRRRRAGTCASGRAALADRAERFASSGHGGAHARALQHAHPGRGGDVVNPASNPPFQVFSLTESRTPRRPHRRRRPRRQTGSSAARAPAPTPGWRPPSPPRSPPRGTPG